MKSYSGWQLLSTCYPVGIQVIYNSQNGQEQSETLSHSKKIPGGDRFAVMQNLTIAPFQCNDTSFLTKINAKKEFFADGTQWGSYCDVSSLKWFITRVTFCPIGVSYVTFSADGTPMEYEEPTGANVIAIAEESVVETVEIPLQDWSVEKEWWIHAITM